MCRSADGLADFVDISCRDFCHLSNIMAVNGALIVLLTALKKIHLKNSSVMSVSSYTTYYYE